MSMIGYYRRVTSEELSAHPYSNSYFQIQTKNPMPVES
ncbi:MAG: hypothetical protein JWP89_5139 [Schlesneria sp.]|nr:hypothetical protein [Schlesneria sp.]